MGINYIRNDVIVNMPGLTRDKFGTSNSIFFTLMREHGPFYNIAAGIETGEVGSKLFIHGNATSLCQFQAQILGNGAV